MIRWARSRRSRKIVVHTSNSFVSIHDGQQNVSTKVHTQQTSHQSLLSIGLCFLLSPSPQPLRSSQVGSSPSVILSDYTFLSVPKRMYWQPLTKISWSFWILSCFRVSLLTTSYPPNRFQLRQRGSPKWMIQPDSTRGVEEMVIRGRKDWSKEKTHRLESVVSLINRYQWRRGRWPQRTWPTNHSEASGKENHIPRLRNSRMSTESYTRVLVGERTQRR